MFLDEELEAVFEAEGSNPQSSFKLLQTCLKRLPNPHKCRPEDFLNTIRQVEGSWKLFCKRHPQYNPDGIKKYFCEQIGLEEKIKNFLHW